MRAVPVISTTVLRGLPGLVRREIGDRALARVLRAAGADLELLEDQDCYIPNLAVVGFLDEAARAAGDDRFGLLLAPRLTVATYGCWGDYVLAADTLGAAIGRCIDAFRYHSSGDRLSLLVAGEEARFSHLFALAGTPGYAQVGPAAAGVLLSLCEIYAPTGWRPRRIELDIPRPLRPGAFEDTFRCPVTFDAPALAIVLDRASLAFVARPRAPRPVVTLEDVARARTGGAPRDLLGVVAQQIRLQVLSGAVSIEGAARALDTSVRTLQRELNRAGTDYRTLANTARNQRAKELLRQTDASITGISMDLGYSAPAHFARAFQRATGLSPSDYRGRTLQRSAPLAP